MSTEAEIKRYFAKLQNVASNVVKPIKNAGPILAAALEDALKSAYRKNHEASLLAAKAAAITGKTKPGLFNNPSNQGQGGAKMTNKGPKKPGGSRSF